MNLYYVSITIAIVSTALYHIFQKSISPAANPAVSLIATYITALFFSFIIYFVYPSEGSFSESLKDLNWASYALAGAIIGLEIGFLLAYRAGWNLGYASLLVNVIVAVILLVVGIFAFKESLNLKQVIGILISIIGIILIKYK